MVEENENLKNLIKEYDQATKLLIRKDIELVKVNAKAEELLSEYNDAAKLLFRKDLELSRANEKLHEVDKIKSNFISTVAHQLRTPLSGIKWTLSLLITGDLGELNSEQKTFLMKTYESNNRMIILVNNLLDADRMHSGKIHYKFEYINITDLIDNILFEITSSATKKNISIEFKNIGDNLPKVYADVDTIRSAFQNLLDNAVNYTMKGGHIILEIKTKGDFLEISISDNGIGIPEDEKKNIFRRFFRASNAVKHLTDGSGLGLYIAKEVVEKNGGDIWFDSTLGVGTTFYFTIPTKE